MSSNLDLISGFVAGTHERRLPAPILDATKKCLVDWFAVSLAALADTAPAVARRQMLGWSTTGRAMNLYGDRGAAAPMALVNGTLSHSLDYDDMHFGSAYHASGPTMAATLAVGMDRARTELEVLNAFATGFEVGATLGERGTGPRLAASGWHPTGVLGHFSAVCSAAALLRLSPQQIANALGLAATQAGGLQASGGSMAKPFHVGKAAMNGVMAAELAAMGMDANQALLDHPVKGVLGCLFQQALARDLESLGRTWQIEGNTFKPYAACQLTHAPYEAAFGMARDFRAEGLRGITVHVHPLAIAVAGRPRAATPMEGKFSIAYCVGLGLLGHGADISGFSQHRLDDPALRRLPEVTRVLASDTVERCAARIELDYGEAGVVHGETMAVLGSPGRPMSWSDLDRKFLAIVEPAWGADANHLLDTLHSFERPGQLATVETLIGRHAIQEER
jgi:2-methylcitrate dehydratase PrpD